MITGEDVKHARGRLKLTQAQLAGMVGVSRRTVAEWEASEELSSTVTGRLSSVFGDMDRAPTNAGPLASVSDLELVAEMARRLSSLRGQIDGRTSDRTGEPAPQPVETGHIGHHTDDEHLLSGADETIPVDAGVVGTELKDADGAPGFSDRQGDAC